MEVGIVRKRILWVSIHFLRRHANMRLAWSKRTINLKLGLLHLSKWTNDFSYHKQKQTHTKIWVRLMELLREYWRQCTLFEITSAIGTPLALDNTTLNWSFGHYARVLVDIDLSKNLFEEIFVEREGYAFNLGIVSIYKDLLW
jgi:hypothetical protein